MDKTKFNLLDGSTRPPTSKFANTSALIWYVLKGCIILLLGKGNAYVSWVAGVVQWQDASFPSLRRGFDSLHPLHFLRHTASTRDEAYAAFLANPQTNSSYNIKSIPISSIKPKNFLPKRMRKTPQRSNSQSRQISIYHVCQIFGWVHIDFID